MDVLADFDAMVARLEASYRDYVAASGGALIPAHEIKMTELRQQLAQERAALVPTQARITEVNARFEALEQQVEQRRQQSEAFRAAVRAGEVPMDAEGEAALLMTDVEIAAIIRRLVKVPTAPVARAFEDAGDAADLTSAAYRLPPGQSATAPPPTPAAETLPPNPGRATMKTQEVGDLSSGHFPKDD